LYEFKKYSEIIKSYESLPGQLTLIDLNMDYEKKTKKNNGGNEGTTYSHIPKLMACPLDAFIWSS